MKLEREVVMFPAYDKRDPNPKKDYGIHGVDLRMMVKGPKGVIQFVIYTHWQLPHIYEEWEGKRVPLKELFYRPMPADLGYHAYTPTYEGQELSQQSCQFLDGEPCYYDGSSLRAEDVFQILLTQGSEGVWKYLEDEYKRRFEEED